VMRVQDVIRPSSEAKTSRSRVVGENLQALRQAQGISLKAAAGLCSVSAATLSRIENGLISPTFDVLARISDGLGIALGDLVRAGGRTQDQGWMTETRAGAGPIIETPQYRFEFLCDDVLAKSFLVLRADILCRTMTDFGEMHSHSGQEQITVQTGLVEVRLGNESPTKLTPGDSLAFDSRLEHAVLAPEGEAAVLWVFAPQGGV